MISYDMISYDMTSYDLIWYDIISYDMIAAADAAAETSSTNGKPIFSGISTLKMILFKKIIKKTKFSKTCLP